MIKRVLVFILVMAFALALAATCAPRLETKAQTATSATVPAPISEDAAARALYGLAWDADAPSPLLLRPEAEEALLALHSPRAGRPNFIAVRATLALRHHPTRRVREALLATLAARAHTRVVAASLDTLGRAFARTGGPSLRAQISPHLQDNDPEIRAAARAALARVRVARWVTD